MLSIYEYQPEEFKRWFRVRVHSSSQSRFRMVPPEPNQTEIEDTYERIVGIPSSLEPRKKSSCLIRVQSCQIQLSGPPGGPGHENEGYVSPEQTESSGLRSGRLLIVVLRQGSVLAFQCHPLTGSFKCGQVCLIEFRLPVVSRLKRKAQDHMTHHNHSL